MFKKSMTVVSSFVILVNLIFLCIFFFFITGISTKFVEKKVFESNKILCDVICTKLLEKLNEPIVTSRMMAKDSFLLDFLRNEGELKHDEEVMKEYLSRIKDEFGYSQATLISAKTHRYYRDDEMHKIINPLGDSHDVWFNKFEQSSVEYAFNIYRSPDGLEFTSLYINFRINDDDGTFLGVSSPAFALKDIIDFIAELEKTYNVKINTTDDLGTVMLDSNYSDIGFTSLAKKRGCVTSKREFLALWLLSIFQIWIGILLSVATEMA
nr:cache domain-containing protein [Treponema sp.]